MIGAGDLDRRIELQAASVANDAEYNEEVKTWITYATVWARQDFHKASENEEGGRRYADFGQFLTIRHRDDVSVNDRIVMDSENFEIIGRGREIGRKHFLKLQVRLVE